MCSTAAWVHETMDVYMRAYVMVLIHRKSAYTNPVNLGILTRILTMFLHDHHVLNLLPSGSEQHEVLPFGSI